MRYRRKNRMMSLFQRRNSTWLEWLRNKEKWKVTLWIFIWEASPDGSGRTKDKRIDPKNMPGKWCALSPSVTYLTHIPKAFHGAVRVYMSATLVRLIRWSQMMRRYYPMFFLMGVICVPLYRRIWRKKVSESPKNVGPYIFNRHKIKDTRVAPHPTAGECIHGSW